MDRMTGAGQSPQNPCNMNGVGGSSRPGFNSGDDGGPAEAAPIRRTSSGVSLQRVLRVGSWNILTISEEHRLPDPSDELSRLRMDIVGL